MTDYTNTFGGAAQDAASATILGAEWDTEYENIATAIATKQDKIAAPTDGNLIELDGSGVPTDAGISRTPLVGLTGVVETALADLEPGATPSGWIQVGNRFIPDGSSALAEYDFTEDQYTWLEAFDSDGQVGSTASSMTNKWATLDAFDGYDVTIIKVGIHMKVISDDTSAQTARFYGTPDDVTLGNFSSTMLAELVWSPQAASESGTVHFNAYVPVRTGASGIQFLTFIEGNGNWASGTRVSLSLLEVHIDA